MAADKAARAHVIAIADLKKRKPSRRHEFASRPLTASPTFSVRRRCQPAWAQRWQEKRRQGGQRRRLRASSTTLPLARASFPRAGEPMGGEDGGERAWTRHWAAELKLA